MASEDLHTDRTTLSPFRLDDLDDLAALAADPDVMRFIGSGPESRETVQKGLNRAIDRWQSEGMSWWTIRDRETAQLIGRCCLQRCADLPDIELGFALHKVYWGRGFASEAVRRMIALAFEEKNVPSIIAVTDPRNQRSITLLERHGFIRESSLKRPTKDVVVYRLKRA